MLNLHVTDETSPLKSVVLGIADGSGKIPKLEDAYDPKSREHIKAGTYPKEKDIAEELHHVEKVLQKYGVEVLRPKDIPNYNQIFTRDPAFVIDDKFVISNILPDREREIHGMDFIIEQIAPENVLRLSKKAHIEGGDVMLAGDYLFIGTYRGKDYSDYITARTNPQAVEELKNLFPHKKVKSFNLRKSNTNAHENALHLDCCFQPVGKDKAIIHKNGFLEEEEYNWLVDFYGKDNVFEISKQEMYDMNSNIFSISEEIVISDPTFTRLNSWLHEKGIKVEEVSYREIAKQEGLFRCTTLPLVREK